MKGTLPIPVSVLPNGGSIGPASRVRQLDFGRNASPARSSTLPPERGCPQPQQHRPRDAARVFRNPIPRGRAAAEDSRAPAMSRRSGAAAGSACASAGKSSCAGSAATVQPGGSGKPGTPRFLRGVFPSSVLHPLRSGSGGHRQVKAWCKPLASALHAGCTGVALLFSSRLALVHLLYRSYTPLVLPWLPPPRHGDATDLLPKLDRAGFVVIQTESDFYFGLASVAACARRRHSW